ncbi:hypothetical protein LCGC14_0259160 [marine sediment metagenome]|uniref:Uncharacterized protein n=1 Tax=marine sediment metagenome TaxID=412755 RepID=A0A0F9WMW3_9ZZZZ
MKLTPENKKHIDGPGQVDLLRKWRFAPSGDPWFQGETGDYWGERITELRAKSPGGYVAASKRIGWSS